MTKAKHEIVLTLPIAGAKVLRGVAERIAGLPSGPRKHMDAIRQALENIGIQPINFDGEGAWKFTKCRK